MSLRESIVGQFRQPRGFWGWVAGRVMQSRGSNRERMVWTVDLLDLKPTDHVLEIGFGPGISTERVARVVTAGRVVGVDHSELMVATARIRVQRAGLDGRVELHAASVANLPKFGADFDKVFAINSFPFWPDKPAHLAALRGAMKPGGAIALTSQPRTPKATAETTEKNGREYERYLKDAGFTDVRLEWKRDLSPPAVCALAKK